MSNIRHSDKNTDVGTDDSEDFISKAAFTAWLETFKKDVIGEILLKLEPVIENVVRKVINEDSKKPPPAEVQTSGTYPGFEEKTPIHRNLSLKFVREVSHQVYYTGQEIRGEGDTMIELALVDMCTGKVIKSGTLAFAKVEIVPLKEDFGECNRDWTSKEFNSNIVWDEDTDKSLLTGYELQMNEGIGYACVKFRNSPKWTKKCKRKLGARLVNNLNDKIVVKEALTESFTLMDFRLKRQKKRGRRTIPSPFDDVSCLPHIDKDRKAYQRLRDEKVDTVEDFLILLFKDSARLESMLGFQPNMLKNTVEQAGKCVSLKRMVWYTGTSKNRGIVFDIFGKVLGMVLKQHFICVEQLSENDKASAPELLDSARKSWDNVVCFADEASFLASVRVDPPSSSPNQSLADDHDFDADFKPLDYTNQDFPTTTSYANATRDIGFDHEEQKIESISHSLLGDDHHDGVVNEQDFNQLYSTFQVIISSPDNANGSIKDHEASLGEEEMEVEGCTYSPGTYDALTKDLDWIVNGEKRHPNCCEDAVEPSNSKKPRIDDDVDDDGGGIVDLDLWNYHNTAGEES